MFIKQISTGLNPMQYTLYSLLCTLYTSRCMSLGKAVVFMGKTYL